MSEPDRSAVSGYVRAVERRWSELSERPSILSPRDWTLVERWCQRGIPLQVIQEAIEATAERLRRPGAKPPKSLSYIAPAVEESWRVVLEGQLAGSTAAVKETPDRTGGITAWKSALAAAGPATRLGRLLADLLELQDAGTPAADLDTRLDDGILEATPASIRDAIRAELEAELAPYRGRMSLEEFESTVRKAWVRRLRTQLKLPALDARDPDDGPPA